MLLRSNDDIYDKAVVSLGPVCNIGNETDEVSEDDVIKIRFVFRMEEHELNVENAKNWVSVGLMFLPTRMWVGQLAVYSKEEAPLDYTPAVSLSR